jgi:hypothetical protein
MLQFSVTFHDKVTHEFIDQLNAETLDEAKQIVCKRFPGAVFDVEADMLLAWECESEMRAHSRRTVAFILEVTD